MNTNADFERFVQRLLARLEVGARTYGSTSFERPIAELIGEVMAEAEDICGWTFLAWLRLDALRGRVEQIEQLGGNNG
ncbi:MAG: hypothetical protein ABIP94_06190 [Planctomycetota bacterium]